MKKSYLVVVALLAFSPPVPPVVADDGSSPAVTASVVPIGAQSLTVPWAELGGQPALGSGATDRAQWKRDPRPFKVTVTRAPSFGTVTVEADGLRYVPNSAFWNAGTDSLGVRRSENGILGPERTVWIAAGDHRGEPALTFEPGSRQVDAFVVPLPGVEVSAGAALRGVGGARAGGETGRMGAALPVLRSPRNPEHGGGQQGSGAGSTFIPPTSGGGGGSGGDEGDGLQAGESQAWGGRDLNGQQGSGASSTFRPPTGSGGGSSEDGSEDGDGLRVGAGEVTTQVPGAVLLYRGSAGGAEQLRLTLKPDGDGFLFRGHSSVGEATSPVFLAGGEAHRFDVAVSQGVTPAVAQIYLDGRLVDTLRVERGLPDGSSAGSLWIHQMGVHPLGDGPMPVVRFDDMGSTGNPEAPLVALDATEGFETPTLENDWTVTGDDWTWVTGANALTGDASLVFDIAAGACRRSLGRSLDGSTDLFGARWSFAAELSATDSTPFAVELFGAASADGDTPVGVVLGRGADGPYLRLRALEADGRLVWSPPVPIDGSPGSLTLRWQRALGENAPNGSARLWVDGGEIAALEGLDNYGYRVESYRFGASCLSGRADARVFLDDLEAWREP